MYDFCCGLSEYVHNRESGFFKNTRFFNHVFHSYTHKCTPAFRCNKLIGFDGVNSLICEQFSFFLQNIKTSAKLMSQLVLPFTSNFLFISGTVKKANLTTKAKYSSKWSVIGYEIIIIISFGYTTIQL